MKPSVGRIVHVIVDPKDNNGSDVAAAVITRVWSDECVNIRILHDGPTVPPEGSWRQDWMTSIRLFESREAADAAHAEMWASLPADQTPPRPFACFWPPRVERQAGDRPAQH